jgi:hypothetical protein
MIHKHLGVVDPVAADGLAVVELLVRTDPYEDSDEDEDEEDEENENEGETGDDDDDSGYSE